MSTSEMVMASSTMAAMTGMTMSSTGTVATASATSTAMSMGMGGGNSCKISMLWNWYTVDSCFISSTWHITSHGMFAGSCIGVIFLVIALEFLRRAGKEYDRFILREHQNKITAMNPTSPSSSTDHGKNGVNLTSRRTVYETTFRPTMPQQAVRALLHMMAFAVAYFVMLLAMYYNGYIIICIFIGAFIGFFTFGWEYVTISGPEEETTVCCG